MPTPQGKASVQYKRMWASDRPMEATPTERVRTTWLLVLFQRRPVKGCRTEGLPASWRKTRGGLSVQDAEETHF